MNFLTAMISRLLGRTNAPPVIPMGLSDDGSGPAVSAGKPSPLRVDPTSGALLVKATAGEGAGTLVDQGTAGVDPWLYSGQSVQNVGNTLLSTLGDGATFTGTWSDTNHTSMIVTSFRTDRDVSITMQFSSDGTNVHSSIGPYVLKANTNSPQVLTPSRRYYRILIANGSGDTANVATETRFYSNSGQLYARFQDTPNQLSSAIYTKALNIGQTEGGGVFVNQSISAEGHAEVAILAPRTAFGELAIAADAAGIQRSHFQYGFNSRLDRRRLTGSATFDRGTGTEKTLMIASTGTTPGSVAIGGSAKREVYFAGMGKKIEFTARFTTPTTGTEQWIAFGDERDGLGIGCNGSSFGIRHWYFGQYEVRTLEITTAATGTETATVTLNGVAVEVALVNASSNKNITANAIAKADYSSTGSGWNAYAYASGSSVYVVFVSRTAESLTGTFSLSSTGGAAGTFSRTVAGAAPTVDWIPQTSWSYDRFDGTSSAEAPVTTNPSGFAIDPTDLGVYKFSVQYLGNGDLLFFVENPANGQFCAAHLIARAGEFAQTSFGNMALPMTLYASNGATSNDIRVATASYYVANEGDRTLSGVSVPVRNFRTGVNSEVAIVSIRNPLVWNGEPNTIPLIMTDFDLTNTAGTGIASWRIVRNATLGTGASATASFVQPDANSPMLIDTTYAGAVTEGVDFAYAYQAPNQGTQRKFEFKSTDAGRIYPGETITICCSVNTGAGITCGAAFNVRQDE